MRADKFKSRIESPSNTDDPNWLREKAEAMRAWAHRREVSFERRAESRVKDENSSQR
jgi:hypothetical protein